MALRKSGESFPVSGYSHGMGALRDSYEGHYLCLFVDFLVCGGHPLLIPPRVRSTTDPSHAVAEYPSFNFKNRVMLPPTSSALQEVRPLPLDLPDPQRYSITSPPLETLKLPVELGLS